MTYFVTNFVTTLHSTITAPSAKLKIDLLFKSHIISKSVTNFITPLSSTFLPFVSHKCKVPKLFDNWFAAGTQNL